MDDSTPFATRNAIGRVLSLLAVVVMVIGAFLPIFDRPIARGGQILAMIAAATAAAAVIAPLGSRFALTFLWAAFGMACAIGIIGIFSIGFVYWIAAALLLAAIFTTPNRSGLELRYDWRYIAAFFVGFLMLFLSVVI